MIDNKIIRIASDNKYYGLKNTFTHKCSLKNKKCGDNIVIELIVKKDKINSMRYEAYSCIYCLASANLVAKKIKKLSIKKLRNDIIKLNNSFKYKSSLPRHFSHFKEVINSRNMSRLDCIMLPFQAVLKALKI